MSDSNPSIDELYSVAHKVIDLAELLAHTFDFEKTPLPESAEMVANILGSLSQKTWDLNTRHSVSADRQINASRQNKPVELSGDYPNALHAVFALGTAVIQTVCGALPDRRAFAPREDDLGSETAWQASYRDQFDRVGLLGNRNEWKAYCRRFRERLPRFNLQKFRTALSLEEAAAEQAGKGKKAAGDGVPAPLMTEYKKPKDWCAIFEKSWDTLKPLFESQHFRNQKLSSKSYRVAIDDLPAKHKAKFAGKLPS